MYTNPSIKMLTSLRAENSVCVCVCTQVCVFHLLNRLFPIWWELISGNKMNWVDYWHGVLAKASVSSVQSLSHIRLFVTPWTAARQASLSITNSQSLLKLMSIELVMPSNHLILCRPLLFPTSIFPSKIEGKAYGVLSETAKY